MFEENGILYADSSKELLKIQDAKVIGSKVLLLTFSSGEKRAFDATVLKGNVFAPLNDPAIFNNFKIVHGVITWMNEDIDCAPEYMYEHSHAYLLNVEEVAPYPDELAAIAAYKAGDPNYQPSISQEDLMKELGIN